MNNALLSAASTIATCGDGFGSLREAGSAVNTWNARRVAVLSWLAWCRERGHDAPQVPTWAKRPAVPDSETRPARRWLSTG